MHVILGIVVFVVGVGVLGWWGSNHNAPDMEEQIGASATEVLGENVHPVWTTTRGRDITVTGLVNSEAKRDEILARVGDVEGRRVVVSKLEVLPTANPYTFQAAMGADGATYSGNTPTQAQRGVFADRIGAGADSLTLAAGLPDAQWPGVVGQGLDALGHLKNGELSVEGQTVTLTGLAALPANKTQAQAALAGLPDGYTLNDAIELEDDGTPMRLSVAKGANGLGDIVGKLPAGLGLDGLGLGGMDAAVEQARIPAATEGWDGFLSTGLGALNDLDAGAMSVSGNTLMLEGNGTREGRAAAEAKLAGIAAPYAVATDLSYTDDGRPFALDASYDGSSVMSAGKFPHGMSDDLAAEVLGVEASTTQVDIAEIESADGQWPNAANTGLMALGKLETGHLTLQNQDVILTGVGSRAELAAAGDVLQTLPAGFNAKTDLAIADDGMPLQISMTSDGEMGNAKGKLPFGMAEAAIVDAFGKPASADMTLAEIDAPDAEWSNIATTAVGALSKLESGELTMTDRAISLSGTALTPDHGAQVAGMLAALPAGYSLETNFDYVDDGLPPAFAVDYAVDRGARVTGKLPAGLTAPDIASALNLTSIESTATEGLSGAPEASTEALSRLSAWLPELDKAVFSSENDTLALSAVPAPGVDLDLLQAGLSADFPDGTELNTTAALPDAGTTRINALTGLQETFSGVAWIPVFQFAADVESCKREADIGLQQNKISFLSGKARLDAKSVRAINLISGIVTHCLNTTDLVVEVAGHTDSDGSAEGNQALSQQRAEAVRTAMIERGVDGTRVTAAGYGEEQPIADNGTDAGKAANRRTEITWSAAAATQTEGN